MRHAARVRRARPSRVGALHQYSYRRERPAPFSRAGAVIMQQQGQRVYGVPRLTADEVAFFKTHGFLVKRAVLDPALVSSARAAWWACCPSPYVREDDPDSWLGGFANKPDFEELAAASQEAQDKNAILNNGMSVHVAVAFRHSSAHTY